MGGGMGSWVEIGFGSIWADSGWILAVTSAFLPRWRALQVVLSALERRRKAEPAHAHGPPPEGNLGDTPGDTPGNTPGGTRATPQRQPQGTTQGAAQGTKRWTPWGNILGDLKNN